MPTIYRCSHCNRHVQHYVNTVAVRSAAIHADPADLRATCRGICLPVVADEVPASAPRAFHVTRPGSNRAVIYLARSEADVERRISVDGEPVAVAATIIPLPDEASLTGLVVTGRVVNLL